MKFSRRTLLAGAAAAVAAGGVFEYTSLRGKLDWRRLQPRDPSRYKASLNEVGERPAVIHVGHSTHVVCLGGTRVMTDPWFYDPAFGAMTHDRAPAVAPAELGKLDAVAISHDHADHFDRRAVSELDKATAMIVATHQTEGELRAMGFTDVRVLTPGNATGVGAMKITAVPGKHDIYEIGFVFEHADRRVYFAGDTSQFEGLSVVAALKPSLAILPVDGTRLTGGELWVMTPGDAVAAARQLGVQTVMPSHAEAYFSDPLVDCCIAKTVARAPQLFSDLMSKLLPDVRCEWPAPGGWVPVPAV